MYAKVIWGHEKLISTRICVHFDLGVLVLASCLGIKKFDRDVAVTTTHCYNAHYLCF